MICHGWSGLGFFSRGRSHCLAWKCWQVLQLLFICSMSFVIPGQHITFLAQRFVLVMSWCPSCRCCRSCACSDSVISSASPYRISPSSTINVEACEKYFLKFFGTSEASSGHPSIIICDITHSSGSVAISSSNMVFLWVVKWVWWIAIFQGYLRSWLRMISG